MSRTNNKFINGRISEIYFKFMAAWNIQNIRLKLVENNKKAAEGREESKKKKKGTQNEQIMKTNCLRCVFEWRARARSIICGVCCSNQSHVACERSFPSRIINIISWRMGNYMRVADGPQATFAPNTPWFWWSKRERERENMLRRLFAIPRVTDDKHATFSFTL